MIIQVSTPHPAANAGRRGRDTRASDSNGAALMTSETHLDHTAPALSHVVAGITQIRTVERQRHQEWIRRHPDHPNRPDINDRYRQLDELLDHMCQTARQALEARRDVHELHIHGSQS